MFAGEKIIPYLGEVPTTTRKYTFLFNTYVMMQIFNEINARKIDPDEWNVFKGFFNNGYFLFVIIFSVSVQILLVEFGGDIVGVEGIPFWLHAISVGFGAFGIIWGKK